MKLTLEQQAAQECLVDCIERLTMLRSDVAQLRRRRRPRLPLTLCREIERAIDDAELAINAKVGPWESSDAVLAQSPL